LGRSACDFVHGSSLSIAGRGGLPAAANDPLWIDAVDFIDARASNYPMPSILGCR
jgi:hypothetical protein